MTRLGIILVFAACAAGCQRKSDLFCENNPDQCTDGSTEGMHCGMCIAPLDVCDTATNTCVECVSNDNCTNPSPICDQHACRACSAHTDCASATCLPDGSCANATDVAYVQEGAIGTTCDMAAPCGTMAEALNTLRPNIKVTGTIDEHVGIDSKTLTIVGATGARLTHSGGGGSIVDVAGTSMVTIARIAIGNANAVGVTLNGGVLTFNHVTVDNCFNGGIIVSSGKLVLHQSIVSINNGGGIDINGSAATFDMSNNFIFRNGNTNTAQVGGVRLGTFANDGTNKFEFNTVTDNHIAVASGRAGGVTCDTGGMSTANNILARNDVNGDRGLANSNKAGVCNFLTSYDGDNTGNPLLFKSPDSNFDYRILTGSVAIDQGTTPTGVTVDYDGNHRPARGGNDQGACEVP